VRGGGGRTGGPLSRKRGKREKMWPRVSRIDEGVVITELPLEKLESWRQGEIRSGKDPPPSATSASITTRRQATNGKNAIKALTGRWTRSNPLSSFFSGELFSPVQY